MSDPAVATPIAEFSDTLTYLAHISLGDCGGWTNTIHLWVIQAPRAYFVWDSTVVETVYFTNYSTCADSYLWDFGDGQVSTAETPVHSYATEGEHLVTLVVENFYGRDTFQRTVYSLLDGVTDRPGICPQIFPNSGERLCPYRTRRFSGRGDGLSIARCAGGRLELGGFPCCLPSIRPAPNASRPVFFRIAVRSQFRRKKATHSPITFVITIMRQQKTTCKPRLPRKNRRN